MIRCLIALVLLGTACRQNTCPVACAADQGDNIYFYDDFNKAIEEAQLTGKPIFLEFRCEP